MKNDADIQVRVPKDVKKQAVVKLAEQGETISESVRNHLYRCAGQWNAYVEAGKTVEIRRARLDEVPLSLRESVKNHVNTVFNIRKKVGD